MGPLTPAQEAALLAGLSYFQIHTAACPPGELRGQLLPEGLDSEAYLSGAEFEADLSGANVVPACTSPAEGEGEFNYNPVTKLLSYEIEFEDLLAPDLAAHIHLPALPGANGPPVITIAGGGPPPPGPSPLGSPYIGTVGPLTPAQEAALLAGLSYFQIHTAACPPGELRGQLLPEGLDSEAYLSGAEFEADLSGANVVPACTSPAEGEGEFNYNPVTKLLSYEIEFEDLLAPDLAAHIHLPALPGANGPPVITIAGGGPPPPGPSPLGSPYIGTVGPLTPAQEAALLAGLSYFQIHTAACPPGELRGQLLPGDDD